MVGQNRGFGVLQMTVEQLIVREIEGLADGPAAAARRRRCLSEVDVQCAVA
jgi:hypothetical protein